MQKLTYISLFSSAGVGCYGFKENGFDCIATNELIERRLDVQRFNNKCFYDSGYICGDITKNETKALLFGEINKWKQNFDIEDVDVIIATPPCQGMSVANLKKNSSDLARNSLVIESIGIIKEVLPKFFVFENVPAFIKTACVDKDDKIKTIGEAIKNNLEPNYIYFSRVLNFKNYGSNSSRTRTLVIGVRRDLTDFISPMELFPDYVKEKTLRETIGYLPKLSKMGEISENDIYHSFRSYDPSMRSWIHCLHQGESSFDNVNINDRPHQVINGEIIENVKKNQDKYTRQFWDKVGPCIHTRNDQLASQNTIHPEDDRVFSIRELMKMMSIPDDFKWSNLSTLELNQLTLEQKKEFLKHNEINIRQSIGEAVPTSVFFAIGKKIKDFLNKKNLSFNQIKNLVISYDLKNQNQLVKFLTENCNYYNLSSLCKIVELSNSSRNEKESFYTDFSLINEITKSFPDFQDNKDIYVLEPSVGAGNFLPFIIKKYEGFNLHIDVVDIDEEALSALRKLVPLYSQPHVTINYIHDDFLLHVFNRRYDLIVGNPPFSKLNASSHLLKQYRKENYVKNKESANTASYFLEKSLTLSDCVGLIMPKNILNTPEFEETRKFLSAKTNIKQILDFGEKGFHGVLVETVYLLLSPTKKKNNSTIVQSLPLNICISQPQSYFTDSKLPYWIIYRDSFFDDVFQKMKFGIFTAFRDRQITSKMLHTRYEQGDIRVIKSRNISNDGQKIIDIPGYDQFISQENAKQIEVYKYYKNKKVFLAPNMTYNMRIMEKKNDFLVNGSVAVLELKDGESFCKKDALFISTPEFRRFLQVAHNYQTRSLNIDKASVFFIGKEILC
jgi:DNA (cytosine-5)-methyltransferase 1